MPTTVTELINLMFYILQQTGMLLVIMAVMIVIAVATVVGAILRNLGR